MSGPVIPEVSAATWASKQQVQYSARPRHQVMMANLTKTLLCCALLSATACASKPPPPPPPPPVARPAPPQGPTRTDFKTIAKKLMARCVAGGWIDTWRSTHANVDVARPKVQLTDFEDRTEQDLDSTYLHRTLEQRMRLSGVYDIVADPAQADFLAKGKLLRMAERTSSGDRISVYTAILDLMDPKSGKVVYTCETTVRGEM